MIGLGFGVGVAACAARVTVDAPEVAAAAAGEGEPAVEVVVRERVFEVAPIATATTETVTAAAAAAETETETETVAATESESESETVAETGTVAETVAATESEIEPDPDLASVSSPHLDLAIAHPLLASSTLHRYGVMFDAGVPDGATVSVVVRPVRALRLDAGVSYNDISNGIRGGVTWVPLASWASPTVSLDVGHYGEGDANPLVRMLTGKPTFSSAVLDRVGYDYADAHVGLELGRKRFTFYLHAGASRITSTVHDAAMLVGGGSSNDPNMPKTTISFLNDPTVTLTTLSARVGFIFYFAK